MKTKFILTALALCVAVINIGCTSTRKIADINGIEIHRITARSAFAPNVTVLVTADPKKPGEINIPVQASGSSLANTIVGAAGGVGAATMLGHSLKPDRTNVSNNSTSEGGSADVTSGNTGGSVTKNHTHNNTHSK